MSISETATVSIYNAERTIYRTTNDTNGNPRFVVHFLSVLSDGEKQHFGGEGINRVSDLYNRALWKMKTVSGRKYHTKAFGGGIVFSTYESLQQFFARFEELALEQDIKTADLEELYPFCINSAAQERREYTRNNTQWIEDGRTAPSVELDHLKMWIDLYFNGSYGYTSRVIVDGLKNNRRANIPARIVNAIFAIEFGVDSRTAAKWWKKQTAEYQEQVNSWINEEMRDYREQQILDYMEG